MNIEMSQVVLNNGLTFLAVSTGIMVLIVGGFIIKLLIDLSKLAKNANETTVLLNTELKPTLNELNKTLKSVNEIVQNTGECIGNMKLGIENVFKKTKILSGNILSGFLKGFMGAYTLFCKKK